MQRHLSFFFLSLLILVYFVDSYVVLSAQDVSRLGREEWQRESSSEKKSLIQPSSSDSFLPVETDDIEQLSNKHQDKIPGMLVKISLRENRGEVPRALSHLLKAVDSHPFMPENDEIGSPIQLSAPRSIDRVFSRMSHALKQLINTAQQEAEQHRGLLNEKIRERAWTDDADSRPAPPTPQKKQHHHHHHGHHKDGDFDEDHEHHAGGWHRKEGCQTDISRYCSNPRGVYNYKFLTMECLKRQDELSPQCQAELSQSTTYQCVEDTRRLCEAELETMPRDNSWREMKNTIINCLELKWVSLSSQCLGAINNRRDRHGQEILAPLPPTESSTTTNGYADYYDVRDPNSDIDEVEPPIDSKPPRHTYSQPELAGRGGPKWAVIAIIGVSAAFVFMAALTVVVLVQRKRRRRQQAVLEAANSLNIPPPPTDVLAPHTIRVTEGNMAPMAMPYYRLDEAPAV